MPESAPTPTARTDQPDPPAGRGDGRVARAALGSLLVLVMAAVAFVVGPGGVTSAPEASASHSQLMTLRGTVTIGGHARPGATVKEYHWTGSAWQLARTTTTDSAGRYAIVAGRGHYFYLAAVWGTGGHCPPLGAGIWSYSTSTNWFYTDPAWHNPTYVDLPLSGGRVC